MMTANTAHTLRFTVASKRIRVSRVRNREPVQSDSSSAREKVGFVRLSSTKLHPDAGLSRDNVAKTSFQWAFRRLAILGGNSGFGEWTNPPSAAFL
jgi:hypothetical protein